MPKKGKGKQQGKGQNQPKKGGPKKAKGRPQQQGSLGPPPKLDILMLITIEYRSYTQSRANLMTQLRLSNLTFGQLQSAVIKLVAHDRLSTVLHVEGDLLSAYVAYEGCLKALIQADEALTHAGLATPVQTIVPMSQLTVGAAMSTFTSTQSRPLSTTSEGSSASQLVSSSSSSSSSSLSLTQTARPERLVVDVIADIAKHAGRSADKHSDLYKGSMFSSSMDPGNGSNSGAAGSIPAAKKQAGPQQ